MLTFSMEAQTNMEMTHGALQEERNKEPVDDMTEEQFLKDLYLHMRKRDTPIERIPHLGFKQIDLYVMFKTVGDLGGYHQVTAQQLWKQVYNTLGGNPRSTSAATCTRRHYEKLLLPYECHVKGILMKTLPQHQPKQFHYPGYSKDDDDNGPRPAKRKMITIPMPQIPYNHQSDPHGNIFPMPFSYSPYFHPSAILSPYIPISPKVLTSPNPPAPKLQFHAHPSFPTPTERVKEPLELLRGLADKYKESSGLIEPLNLSIKPRSPETNRNTASSFSPPSASNLKFLNDAPRQYSLHHQEVKNERCVTQDGTAAVRAAPYLSPLEEKDVYIKSAPNSPAYDCSPALRTDEGVAVMAQKPSSPKTDFTICGKEDKNRSLDLRRLNLSHILPSLPQDNGGKMEIEIPLSVLHDWLRLCESSATTQGAKQPTALSSPEDHSGPRNFIDVLSTSVSSHIDPQLQSSVPEDLSLKQRKLPSPTPTNHTSGNHHNMSQNHFTSYKALSPGGALNNTSCQDVYPVDQLNIMKSYKSRSPHCWDVYNKERSDSIPLSVQEDFIVTKPYSEDTPKGEKDSMETGPSAFFKMNSSTTSVLQFTPEEMMKLKKIIASSL